MPEQRKHKLDETIARRRELKARLDGVAKKREEWLKTRSGTKRADSFDALLAESLKAEGASKGIVY